MSRNWKKNAYQKLFGVSNWGQTKFAKEKKRDKTIELLTAYIDQENSFILYKLYCKLICEKPELTSAQYCIQFI